MDKAFIKEEKEKSDSIAPSSSSSNRSSTLNISSPPTQLVSPSTLTARQGVSAFGEGGTTQETELLNKVKKLLCLVIKFGQGISATVGHSVKQNVTSLVVGSIPVPEFLKQLQLTTSFPVRPFVLPFLQSNIHRLREEVQRLAMTSNCSPSTFLANNQSLLEHEDNQRFIPAPNDIFQCEEGETKSSGFKRKNIAVHDDISKLPRIQPSSTSPPVLPSGPSFPSYKSNSNLAMVSGYPREPQVTAQDAGASHGQEDEWKNIKVMLNCVCGMVEKTQSAISILQQRQADIVNIKATEEIVVEVQTKASIAILEVKQAALDEIRQSKAKNNKKMNDNQTNSKEESCWNCGRPATETCSGCSLARYCGPFCQHKDWEDHARVCRPDLTMEDHSRQQRGMAGSPPPRDRRADTPSRK